MHGLIFATWEKYLTERFKGSVLREYREALEGKIPTPLLASRVYSDEILLAGVATVSQITNIAADTLLREYGRFFIINGLTRHLCAYILTQVHSARELLLAMHDAHQQMGRLPDSLTPPLFQYKTQTQKPDELILIYDSPRKLCSVLIGAIEGAAERYEEQVHIVEQTCMKQGASACCFEIRFSASSAERWETSAQLKQQQAKHHFAQFILSLLPDNGGITLAELQKVARLRGVKQDWARPAILLEVLRHLHHAGLVANTANHAGDDFGCRRYWRVLASGQSLQGYLRVGREKYVYK